LLDERLTNDDRLHDADVEVGRKGADLVAQRGERAVLDFDQLAVANDVDPIAPHPNFDRGIVAGVEPLEIAMERRFHFTFDILVEENLNDEVRPLAGTR
jgi:hypothetical protein